MNKEKEGDKKRDGFHPLTYFSKAYNDSIIESE